MRVFNVFISCILGFGHLAVAHPWEIPQPTDPAVVLPNVGIGYSPKPTGVLDLLRKRQIGRVCGYVNGDASQALTCNNPALTCTSNTALSVFNCCSNTVSCFATLCYALTNLAYCTGACLANPFVARCTDTDYPFCATFVSTSAGNTFSLLECDTEDYSSTAYSSYTTTGTVDSSSPTLTFPSITRVSSTSRSTSSSPTSTSTTTSTRSSTPTATPGPSHVGPIVGGVVGGIAGLALIATIIFFCVTRPKHGEKNGPHPGGDIASPGLISPQSPQMQQQAYSPPQQPYSPAVSGYYAQPASPYLPPEHNMSAPSPYVVPAPTYTPGSPPPPDIKQPTAYSPALSSGPAGTNVYEISSGPTH
ncbi:MAG: hypothetical protein M1813_007915 [Trichoglossum hirsutum]|nr:MAG: hypothetical protein M1813_007915 [Trichoglossum hirsutum]